MEHNWVLCSLLITMLRQVTYMRVDIVGRVVARCVRGQGRQGQPRLCRQRVGTR